MRRLRPLCLTLAGLALIAPSVVRAEDPPGVVYDAEGRAVVPNQKKDWRHRRPAEVAAPRPPRLCAACAAKMMQQGQMQVVSQAVISEPGTMGPAMAAGSMPMASPSSLAAAPTCAACGHAHAETVVSAPGRAMVGQPTSNTPGLAYVGPEAGSLEPAPVGVVRTSYGSPAATSPGTLGASVAGHASTAGNNLPYARPDELPPSLYQPPTPRRHHILAHILGIPTRSRIAAENEAKARSSHAMISYGSNGSTPSELPASMVYGSGGK